jgi:hypothetical protein
MTPRRAALAGLILACVAGAWSSGPVVPLSGAELPDRLSDREFWRLVEEFSEPSGFFRSDNLVSNEDTYQFVIPALTDVVKPGGVYVGVGPDQNFTYIASLRPRMAFITDVRRGNLHVHLLYKALFELSADRAEFLSRLFSRPRPDGVSSTSSPEALFTAYAAVDPDRALYDANFDVLIEHLSGTHRFRLSEEDVSGIAYVSSAFYAAGPYLAYSNGFARGRRRYPTYQDLQLLTDGRGTNRGYLATEEGFQFLKAFQARNLLVPIVGNFAGQKALRSVGAYLREREVTVTTFYTSNVEQYLFQDGLWPRFAANLSALPIDESSTLIRSCFNSCASSGYRSLSLLDSIPDLLEAADEGAIRVYWDVLSRSR